MRRNVMLCWTTLFMLLLASPLAAADKVYPAAILPFAERGADVKDLGAQVTDLMFANLVAEPQMYLVDREDMDKVLKELELNLSGLVSADSIAVVFVQIGIGERGLVSAHH